jgi:hypothetical protein
LRLSTHSENAQKGSACRWRSHYSRSSRAPPSPAPLCLRRHPMVLAMLGALSFLATAADARVGGGGSFGSRGSRTYSSPPATNTAPSVAPIDKSMTQPGKAPTAQAPVGGSSWFGGWRSILMGGLIAGVLASIFGFDALASVLGFILRVALTGGIVWLVMAYLRNRQAQPATAGASTGPASNPDYRHGGGGGATPTALEIARPRRDPACLRSQGRAGPRRGIVTAAPHSSEGA